MYLLGINMIYMPLSINHDYANNYDHNILIYPSLCPFTHGL